MKRITALFCLMVLSSLAFAGGDAPPELDWQFIQSAKGGVTQCEIAATGPDADFVPKLTAFFDAKGKITKLKSPYDVKEFIYDSASRLIEIVASSMDENNTLTPYNKTVYTYDAKGKLTKIAYTDGEGNEIMADGTVTYDKNGNIKIEKLTPEGSVLGIDTLNKNLNPVESLRYTGPSVAMGEKVKDIESKTACTYDKDGNLILRVIDYITPMFEGMPKKVTQKIAYTFDKAGNKLTMKTTITPKDVSGIFGNLMLPPYKFTYSTGSVKPQDTKPKEDKPTVKNRVGAKVQVDYQGSWYPATVLKQENGKYLIHYDEYDESWDEWVTDERIKF